MTDRAVDRDALLLTVEHLDRLELYGEAEVPAAVIENRPGQQLSLAIYYKVAVEFGGIGPAAARRALNLFGGHVEDARAAPGRHPHIERLFRILEHGEYFAAKAIPKT